MAAEKNDQRSDPESWRKTAAMAREYAKACAGDRPARRYWRRTAREADRRAESLERARSAPRPLP